MFPMEEDLAALARPGWIPFVILLVMFVAVFFLWRSMRRMMRTIDPDLPREADLEPEGRGDEPTEGAVDRARRGEAPVGPATGLVSPPRDEDQPGADSDQPETARR